MTVLASVLSTNSRHASQVLSELPLNMLAGSVFSIVLYWISNLSHTPGQFFIFWAVILLNTFCGMGLGLLLATMAPDAETANALAPLFNVSMMLLSGFYINVSSLPAGTPCIVAQSISPEYLDQTENGNTGPGDTGPTDGTRCRLMVQPITLHQTHWLAC
jgi:ABC-type multidrug transport system permease subunit